MSDGAGQSGVNNRPQQSWRSTGPNPAINRNRVDWSDWTGLVNVPSNIVPRCKTDFKAIFSGQVYPQRYCLGSSQQALNLLYFLSVPPSHRSRSAIPAPRAFTRDRLRHLQLCLFKITRLKMSSGLCSHSSDPGAQMVPLTPAPPPHVCLPLPPSASAITISSTPRSENNLCARVI